MIEERDIELAELKKKEKAEIFETENDYISMYEQRHAQEQKLEKIFYQQYTEEYDDIESKKPALFRKPKNSEVKDFPSVNREFKEGSTQNMNFAELKKEFRVADTNQVNDMNSKMFEMMAKGLKNRQVKFFAFLNKEFNTLNYKAAKCGYYCYDNDQQSVMEANMWANVCREGITECK